MPIKYSCQYSVIIINPNFYIMKNDFLMQYAATLTISTDEALLVTGGKANAPDSVDGLNFSCPENTNCPCNTNCPPCPPLPPPIVTKNCYITNSSTTCK